MIHESAADRMELVRCLHNEALIHSLAGDQDQALARTERAADLATQIGWARGVERCLRTRGDILVRRGSPEEALEPYDRALARARSAGFRDSVAHGCCSRSWALLYLGQLPEAHASATGGHELASDLGNVRVALSCEVVLGEAARLEDRLDEARELLSGAVERAAQHEIRDDSVGEALAGLARILIVEGRPEEADPLLREAIEILESSGRADLTERLAPLLQ